jgi:DNA-binding response OmpR family regulator
MRIASLRRKLGEGPREHRYIETVRGVGYVMRWPEAA